MTKDDTIARLYSYGHTPMEIARAVQVSRYEVLNALHRKGVKRRRLDLTEGAHDRLRAMIAAGADYRTIAKQMHIPCEVAKLILKGHPY